MFTFPFCINIVDNFKSVSLQELWTTLYGGNIFSKEGDGIQELVYKKNRAMIIMANVKYRLSNKNKSKICFKMIYKCLKTSFNLNRFKFFEQF